MAACFTADAARRIPDELRSVVFGSPLCARSTDRYLVWHPGFRERQTQRLVWSLLLRLLGALAKWTIKILINIRPACFALYGGIKDKLLVVPSSCGQATDD